MCVCMCLYIYLFINIDECLFFYRMKLKQNLISLFFVGPYMLHTMTFTYFMITSSSFVTAQINYV